jgi:hypothetical protein
MATDPGNHVWVANYNPTSYILTLSEFSAASGSLGTALSPSTGYGLDNGVATAYAIERYPGPDHRFELAACGCRTPIRDQSGYRP